MESMDPTTSMTPLLGRVTMLFADAAQVADRKLYVLGGGLTVIGPMPQPVGVAIGIEVPWDRANISHEWRLELLDEDGHPVMIGGQPVAVAGRFEAGRPPGLKPGTPLSVPLAINFPNLPVTPGLSYSWQFSIDGASHTDWRLSFHVRAPIAPPVDPRTVGPRSSDT